ncbi:MAG TPA: peptide chain release factor N(5)-glutamine methyltransferase [Methyloceanibacter sp.]|jgi:release factor glutamine methyltransferase|nr:peptide chain release factor N(5)-glutamine methyltransferase [Methyloceanibacter sp.]
MVETALRHRSEAATALTLGRAFAEAASVLRRAGVETPELDARLLLCNAAGLTHEAYIARGRDELAPEVAARLGASIRRRLKREPVSRITGSREFYGRSFLVDPHALDPRPDTETLIEAALELVERSGWGGRPLKLLDLGTGTGCILITLLAELPQATGLGTDIGRGALALAVANARRLGVATRASFIAGDWLDAIAGEFDLILANPPYLAASEIALLSPEVADFDPRLALDGGRDGLEAYRRIAARAGQLFAPAGRILVEIGATQAEAVAGILRGAGLRLDEAQGIRPDLAGRPRSVMAGV